MIASLGSNAWAMEWLTDLPTAMAQAEKEGKAVLLDFTGSDWCPWCQKLDSEVFGRFEFAAYAASNLIMVKVDFPRHKKISLDQLNANYALASKYGVQGYPSVILLNANGQLLGQCGYVEGGPSVFLARLERFPGMPHKGRYMVARPSPASANSGLVSAQPFTPGANSAGAVAAPVQYGALTLKGVSAVGSRRFALINNETLTVGDSAFVKSFNTNIEVTVKEIRDASVIVIVQGQTHEITLAGGSSH